MDNIKGIIGYASAAQQFIKMTLAVGFRELHRNFIEFFPESEGRVLDVGAGMGRDAAAFAEMGHSVVAVEPTNALRLAGQELFGTVNIEWIDDALPSLARLGPDHRFDFILASGVWHHLDEDEQHSAISRIAELLSPNGIFAVSLRSGPAGVGTTVYPTSCSRTILSAESSGLKTVLCLENQPSLQPNKHNVIWTRLAFRRL